MRSLFTRILIRAIAPCFFIVTLIYSDALAPNQRIADKMVAFSFTLTVLTWADALVGYGKRMSNLQRAKLKSLGLPGVDAYYDFVEAAFMPGIITLCLVALLVLGIEIIVGLLR